MPTRYQVLLIVILLAWPVVIFGILYLMSKLEDYVKRVDAESPAEAGLEPVAGSAEDREVQIVFGDKVVGEPEPRKKPEPEEQRTHEPERQAH